MLGCNDIYRITEKLDNLGVKYDSTEPSKLELPLPGTPIPAEIHHTLLMDPMNVFYPGEYVGYLVDSEGGDIYGSYKPTYTYAIIVQEVGKDEENTSFLGKCFQIDIGYSEYKITVGNPVEARRWLRQARANYSAARNDLHKNANEWVCFKCYLATKLALIAADYAVRGKSDKDVKPTAVAQKVEEYNSQLKGLTNDVQILEGYGVDSLRTRYPDLLPFPQIPNDRYTSEVAMRVMECTARIIIKLETFVQQKT
ncbi:Sacsin [Liparis tanakae]|uniref:Sacsin n=1 Tax=Liparis tanakae TaxID=230148 RepID=A0A4Z2HVQ6_9TELE|nr:Sacsin [Liparis tanakae]